MILLIDDDTSSFRPLAKLLEIGLKSHGVTLRHCSTIASGLETVKNNPKVKLVLLDLMMPCVTTPQAAIAFIPQFPCPVMIYSAHADDQLVKQAAEAGAVGFISKFETAEVQLAKIEEILASVMAAKVRMKVEDREGYSLYPKRHFLNPTLILACIMPLVAVVSFAGGSLNHALENAKEIGRKEQVTDNRFKEDDQHFDRIEKTTEALTKENAESYQWRRRMEINIRLLLLKNGIQPARDDGG